MKELFLDIARKASSYESPSPLRARWPLLKLIAAPYSGSASRVVRQMVVKKILRLCRRHKEQQQELSWGSGTAIPDVSFGWC